MQDDMLAQLIADIGVTCAYRQALADVADPAGWIGPGPAVTTRPVGTRDASWDPTEQAATDSTVDAGTGYVGSYAAAVNVAVLMVPCPAPADAPIGRFGLTLEEDDRDGLLLASAMTPTRGDLVIAPDARYVVGERLRIYGTPSNPLAYRVRLQRRQSGDAVYAV